MLILHLMAKEYGTRPSSVIGIADEWAAYQFDVAVMQIALDELDPKKRRKAGQPTPAQLAKRGR